jgi:hypothetical protein
MTESKWIRFVRVAQSPERKTAVWNVVAKEDGGVLGRVSWFGRWRRYAFFPEPGTVFEPTCLGDITTFITGLMMDRSIARQRARQVGEARG